jgi:hypothetical protein
MRLLRHPRLVRLLCLSALLPVLASAAASWRSVLYPAQPYDPALADLETDKVLQDFSYAGYRRGETPIPDLAGPVFDVTAAPFSADPTGATDATAAIQAAIHAAGAAGGGVVFLPAGTYRLSVPADRTEALLLDKPGVVLRGAGRGRTFLLNTTHAPMRLKAVIRVRGPSQAGFRQNGSARVPLSADLLRSTRIIPVADTTPFAIGDTVVVRNDITDAWVTEHGEPGWLGLGAQLGGLTYRRTVLAVDPGAGTLTVDVPVRYALKLRDQARVVRLAAAPLAEVGLEDFSIANLQHPGTRWLEGDNAVEGTPGHEVSGAFLIMFERVRDCWARRLASYRPAENTSTAHLLSGGVSARESTHVTIEDCVFQRPQYGGGGGNGYLFRLIHSAECLIQRSEARFSRHGLVISGIGASGNVIHASLDAETGRATGADGSYATSGKASDHHMHFSQANLIDSCTAEDSWFEARYRPHGGTPRHNLTAVHSVFWNTRGTGTISQPVVVSEQARHGYVIGTRGPRSAASLPRVAPAGTDPIDHLEGVGLGDSLEPQSLFLDQRARRLGAALAHVTTCPAASLPTLGFHDDALRVTFEGPARFCGHFGVERSLDLAIWRPLPIGLAETRVLADGRREMTLAAAFEPPRTFWRLRAGAPALALDPDLPPGRNFDLSRWKITLPDASEVRAAELVAGYTLPGRFFTDPVTGGMVFRCGNNEGSTTNSRYTRTELRGMLAAAATNSASDPRNNWYLSGAPSIPANAGGIDGTLRATLAVDRVSATGEAARVGRVIVGQIHASTDEPCRLYYHKRPGDARGAVYFAHEYNGTTTWHDLVGGRNRLDPADGIALGETWSYEIRQRDLELTVTVHRQDRPAVTRKIQIHPGFRERYKYFKAGAYNQNDTGESDPERDYVQVTFYELSASHP